MWFLDFVAGVISSPLFLSLLIAGYFFVVLPWIVSWFVGDLLRQVAAHDEARRNQPPEAPAKPVED
jgi:hypothetical protein